MATLQPYVTYTDLNKLFSYSQRIGTMPKKIGIAYEDKKVVGIYLDKTYKTNPSTICVGNAMLTAVRIIVNVDIGNIVPVNEEYGSIHLPSMWANYKHHAKKVHGETYYIGKQHGYHQSVPMGWNNISTILLILHNKDRILHHTIVPNYHYTSCEDPRLYTKQNGKIYMYFMNFLPVPACSELSHNKGDDRRCLAVQEIELKVTSKKITLIGEPITLCPSIHERKGKTDMYQVFEKNFCPFVWNKKDYVCYAIRPTLKCYIRDSTTNVCTALRTPTEESIFYKIEKELGVGHFSQTSPGIPFGDSILAVGHLRVPFKKINDIRNVALDRFVRDRLEEYEQGKIVLHNDIYLSFFYTFKITKDRMEIERFSAPFLFDYANRKFCLDFCTTITKCKKKSGSTYIASFGQGDVLSMNATFKKNDILEMLSFHALLPMDHIMESYRPFFVSTKNSIDEVANSTFSLPFIIENNLYNRGIEDIPSKYQTTPLTLFKWYEEQKQKEKWNLPDTTPFLDSFQGDIFMLLNEHTKPFVLLVNVGNVIKRIGMGSNKTSQLFANESPWYDTETFFQEEIDGTIFHLSSGLFITERKEGDTVYFDFSVKKPKRNTISHLTKKVVENAPIFRANVVPFTVDLEKQEAFKRLKLEEIKTITSQKIAILTMGSRASGKTQGIKKFGFSDYVSINDDDIVLDHPFFEQYEDVYDIDAYRNIVPYASPITEAKYKYALQNGLGMVIESVYPDPIRIKQLVEKEYEFILVYKITPLSTIVKNRYKRMMRNHLYGESFPIEFVTMEQVHEYEKMLSSLPGYKGSIAL